MDRTTDHESGERTMIFRPIKPEKPGYYWVITMEPGQDPEPVYLAKSELDDGWLDHWLWGDRIEVPTPVIEVILDFYASREKKDDA
jgi:hypothetical protein